MKKIILLFTAILSIAACQNPPVKMETVKASSVVEPLKTERLLKELTLSGSGYELGLQHGQQLKKEVSEIVQKWKINTTHHLG